MIQSLKNVFISVAGILILITSFQNCSPMSFQNAQDGKTVGKLQATTDTSTTDGELVPKDDSDNEVAAAGDDDQDDTKDDEKQDKDRDKDKSDLVVCILEGNGSSQRLGYVNQALIAVGSSPQTVCMSSNACLNLIGTKFNVKEDKAKGYCKHAPALGATTQQGPPGVVKLTDDQVTDLLSHM